MSSSAAGSGVTAAPAKDRPPAVSLSCPRPPTTDPFLPAGGPAGRRCRLIRPLPTVRDGPVVRTPVVPVSGRSEASVDDRVHRHAGPEQQAVNAERGEGPGLEVAHQEADGDDGH